MTRVVTITITCADDEDPTRADLTIAAEVTPAPAGEFSWAVALADSMNAEMDSICKRARFLAFQAREVEKRLPLM